MCGQGRRVRELRSEGLERGRPRSRHGSQDEGGERDVHFGGGAQRDDAYDRSRRAGHAWGDGGRT